MGNCCFRSALRVLAVVGAVSALSTTTLGQTLSKGKAQPAKKVQTGATKTKAPVVNRALPPMTPKMPTNLTTGVTAPSKGIVAQTAAHNFARMGGVSTSPTLAPGAKTFVAPTNRPVPRGVGGADNCGDASDFGVGTFPYDLTTATNDYAGTCGSSSVSPDVWYRFIAPADGTAVASTCNTAGGDTVLTVLDECGGPQILCLDDFCGLQTEVSWAVTAGEDYYVRLAGYNSAVHSGTITFSMLGECVLTPPGKGTPEGEECGSDANGGCNSAPPIFGSISCGEVVNGTAFAGGGTRDTDWYQLALDGPHQITVSAQGQFPLQLLVIADGCPAAIITAATAPRCEVATLTATVPGNCVVFVSNSGFDGNICGDSNDYWVSVDSCTPVEGPANDNCADAETITGNGPFAFDNTIATTDGSPDPLCAGSGSDDITNDLWYRWTTTCADGEQATLELCGQTAIDSRVAIYEGTTCVGPIIACNDDACGLQSRVRWNTTPGATYTIRVGNYPSAAGGPGSFTISCAPAPVPACTEFNVPTDCQTTAALIAMNVSTFTLAESFNSGGEEVNSICLNGIYFNSTPVTDGWVISLAEDNGTGVPGAIIDTFTQGVDLTVTGPSPVGTQFVGRDVYEWRLDFARPYTPEAGDCVWVIMNNFSSGDNVFLMDGDGSNGNLQAAQDLNQDGVWDVPGDIIPDDVYLCVNGGFVDNMACFVDPCAGNVPSNDTCETATALSLNSPLSGNTGCAQPEFITSCSGSAWANAVWYSVTGTGNTMTVDLCASAQYDTRLEVFCGDCSNPVCIGSNDDFCGLQSGFTWCSQAGGTYLVAVHGFGGATGAFDITLTDDGTPCSTAPECKPCEGIDPNPAGTDESELCGEDTNGGCNISPFAFDTVDCNAIVNGTTWATGGSRDTDWYRAAVPASGNVSVTVSAEVPAVVFILTISEAGGEPDCVTINLAAQGEVLPCGTTTVSASGLAAGSNVYFFVSVGTLAGGIFEGFPCGGPTGNDYTMSVDIGVPCDGEPCPCDFNDNDVLNSQDFFDFLSCFFTTGCADADYNDDTFVNSQDFFDFLACFFAPPAECN